MTLATALVSGNDPLPRLAEDAVQRALSKAGLTHANGLLLFLTPEFAHGSQGRQQTQGAVTAAARAAQCTQVAGGIAAGVCTEDGWVLDRPAVGAMVFGDGLSLGHPNGEEAVLSYAGDTLQPSWLEAPRRFGASYSGHIGQHESFVWQQGRLALPQQCSMQIMGAQTRIAVSSGLRLLGQALRVESCNGFDLERLSGQPAVRSLERLLPAKLRPLDPRHLHQLVAVFVDASEEDKADSALANGRYRCAAVIATNADGSLTLAEHLAPGQQLTWAIRQPHSAETDMRQTVAELAPDATSSTTRPVGALMFSCIGRGPFFYGGEDRDLDVLRQHLPGTPILGVYGTGQIAPAPDGEQAGNRLLQNAVVTALIHKHRN